MKTILITLVTLLSLFTSKIIVGQHLETDKVNHGFIPNLGQVHDQYGKPASDVLFSGQSQNFIFHIKRNGVSYQLYKRSNVDSSAHDSYRVDITWINSNPKFSIVHGTTFAEKKNFYNVPQEAGITNVPVYSDVTFQEIYPGVMLKWYFKDEQLKYDYIVAPGADFHAIKMRVEGASSLLVNDIGALCISTPFGSISEDAPEVFQNGKKLSASWQVDGELVTYKISGYNPQAEMIIDPAVRVWGTYVGSTLIDVVNDIATDTLGNVSTCGFTTSTSNISTSGAHQTTFAGNNDCFVRRYNSNGSLLWSTYYGGSQLEWGEAIAVDRDGNVYAAGRTRSTSGIATGGAHQTSLQGSGTHDGFLVKFNLSGVRQWGTYYGGSSDDYPLRLDCDTFGNVFMSGFTFSNSGIAFLGHQNTYGAGGSSDAFLVKFNSSGVRQWGTYYGSTGTELGRGCAAAPNGDVYLCGDAPPSSAITTPGAFQTVHGGGGGDAFLVRFDANGNRIWGTYFGGSNADLAYDCVVDEQGMVYLVGKTASTSNIANGAVHQSVYGGGVSDVMVAQFNSGGSRIWATYYGGSLLDQPVTAAAAPGGGIYVTGETLSTNAIATAGAPQTTYGGGGQDGFIALITSSGNLDWGSYYGGNSADYSFSCAAINTFVYIGGRTSSGSDISTAGSAQANYGGDVADGFLVQFSYCASVNATVSASSNISCFGANDGSAIVSATGGGGITYSWAPSGGNSATASGLSSGTYTCTITNNCSSTTTVTVNISEPVLLTSSSGSSSILCNGGTSTVAVNASGGTAPYSGIGTYTVNAGSYSYVITDANGCSDTTTINITEPPVLNTIIATTVNPSGCNAVDGSINLAVSGGTPGYSFVWNNSSTTQNLSAVAAGTYSVLVTDANGCINTASATLNDPPLPNVNLNLAFDTVCSSPTVNIALTGGAPSGGSYSGPGVSSNNFSPFAAGLGLHVITYSYTDSLGCSNAANDLIYVDACTGLGNIQSTNLVSIMPNPASDFVFVSSATTQAINVVVYDIAGKQINAPTQLVHDGVVEINVQGLTNGTYFVSVEIGANRTTQSVIIAR